ncbi:MAG: hypothetical protein GEU96_15145 [Propionibacteriales bacterium]|nr:hypothetical protein [Propionibacteriales bacterium]
MSAKDALRRRDHVLHEPGGVDCWPTYRATRTEGLTSEESGATVQPSTSRRGLEHAYDEAVRTATLTSLLGALGFGVALVVGLRLASENGFLAQGFGLDMMLLAGGVAGGLAFTGIALRASRTAQACRRHLEQSGRGRRP